MSQAAIIINVSDQEQIHSNGLSGTWTVPGKKPEEEFAMLVVYPSHEIQDIGEQRRVSHWLKAYPIAQDIVGLRSDAAAHGVGVSGTKEKWGLLLCEAQPDLTKELLTALEVEIEYLNTHMPDHKFKKDQATGATVAVNVEDESVRAMKQKLSDDVVRERAKFEAYCRSLVQKKELAKARGSMLMEDQRLVAEGDRMWARPSEQANISELHKRACNRLGQERPWSYMPMQLVDCPGCGEKVKENILTCGKCGGWLDEGIDRLRKMPPKERAIKMYPDRDADAVASVGPRNRGAVGLSR